MSSQRHGNRTRCRPQDDPTFRAVECDFDSVKTSAFVRARLVPGNPKLPTDVSSLFTRIAPEARRKK